MASKIRQNFHTNSEAAINKQINMELYASYVYMSMVGDSHVLNMRSGTVSWFTIVNLFRLETRQQSYLRVLPVFQYDTGAIKGEHPFLDILRACVSDENVRIVPEQNIAEVPDRTCNMNGRQFFTTA